MPYCIEGHVWPLILDILVSPVNLPAHPTRKQEDGYQLILKNDFLKEIALQRLKIDFGGVIAGPLHHVNGLKRQGFRKVALATGNQDL